MLSTWLSTKNVDKSWHGFSLILIGGLCQLSIRGRVARSIRIAAR